MSPQFIKARKEGKKAQAYVKGMFESWGWKVREIGDGYHPSFDLEVTGEMHNQQLHFFDEVKWDKKAAETGNIYLDINSLKKSQASIFTICLNDPIDTVLMLPLKQALDYAEAHANINGGEFHERSALVPYERFLVDLKPKILTAPH